MYQFTVTNYRTHQRGTAVVGCEDQVLALSEASVGTDWDMWDVEFIDEVDALLLQENRTRRELVAVQEFLQLMFNRSNN